MKNTCIISLLLFLTIGCSIKSRKQVEIKNLHINDSLKLVYQQDSIQKAKLEIELQLIQDSIIKEEEKIAISDIRFGISRSEYNIKEKEFLKSFLNKENNRHRIGNFAFDIIPCFTENNSLYRVCLQGNTHRTNGPHFQWEYESLYKVFSGKYSEPKIHNGLPKWNQKDHELVWEHQKSDYIKPCGINDLRSRYYECDIWDIGNKRIEIRLYFTGKYSYYSGSNDIIPNSFEYNWRELALVIYQKDILEILEEKKLIQSQKETEENKRKEKEEIEKAINAL